MGPSPRGEDLTVVAPPMLALGDTTGAVWIVRKDLTSDAHFISRTVPPWEAEDGSTRDVQPGKVACVSWRPKALIVALSSGSICAWEVPAGT